MTRYQGDPGRLLRSGLPGPGAGEMLGVVIGPRSTVIGPRSTVIGPRSTVIGPRFNFHGPRFNFHQPPDPVRLK